MPAVVQPLNRRDARELHEACMGMYLDGECYAFAIAMHRGLGWEMLGLLQGGTVRHAMVRDPDGTLHDARGPVSKEEAGDPFGVPFPYDTVSVEEEDLRVIRPVQKLSIERARKLAEVLWPDLPWADSFQERARAFAEDLEALCRRHGIWIRSLVPAVPAVLSQEDGAEGGYVLTPTHDGGTYTIDRTLR